MNSKLENLLTDFVDALETEYGDIMGFEVILEHPVVDGVKQEHADIKEVYLYHITKTEINLKK